MLRRLLALWPLAAAITLAACAGPEDGDEILLDDGEINPNHPRPDPKPEDGEDTDAEDIAQCVDTCAKGCEILIAILDACDSGGSSTADSSGDCESSVPGEKPGPLQALLFSIALLAAIAIRRRGKRRGAVFLAPLFFILINAGFAEAQTPPKDLPPPPPTTSFS